MAPLPGKHLNCLFIFYLKPITFKSAKTVKVIPINILLNHIQYIFVLIFFYNVRKIILNITLLCKRKLPQKKKKQKTKKQQKNNKKRVVRTPCVRNHTFSANASG